MIDVIVIGSGFAGSTAARVLAEKGKKVLIIEKRNHIGGNSYDKIDQNNVPIHIYGPHIFHTNSEDVYNFITKYGKFTNYEHKVKGFIDGKYVPIPFNFKSMEILLKDKAEIYKTELKKVFTNAKKVTVNELLQSDNKIIKEIGDYVFEKVFVNYTAKQWGIPAKDVDKAVLNRVPVTLGYDDRYFYDKYQLMPQNTYSEIFENVLNHKNIEIKLNTNALSLIKIKQDKIYYKNEEFKGQVIYTGEIDELFDYKYDILPYRSVYMDFIEIEKTKYQPYAVVNYPNDNDYTRITEFNHFYGKKGKTTTILKEYPIKYDKKGKGNIPYYVINNKQNAEKYQKYLAMAKNIKNLHLIGRLAEYKYYNMDGAILTALNETKQIN